jgi:hypothetical protein
MALFSLAMLLLLLFTFGMFGYTTKSFQEYASARDARAASTIAWVQQIQKQKDCS